MKQLFAYIVVASALAGCALPVEEPSPSIRAAQAENRLLADASIDGRTGTATPNARSPILVQSVVLRNTVEVLEETGVKWTALDTETIKAGQILFAVGPIWCTHWLVCLADQNQDGQFDTGFMQYNRFNSVLIFTRVDGELGPIAKPVGYRSVPAPDDYRHEIGVMVDRLTKANGVTQAQFTVRVRRARGSWVELQGPGVSIDLDANNKGAFEVLGARIEVQASDKGDFTYTIVRSMPEQQLAGTQIFR